MSEGNFGFDPKQDIIFKAIFAREDNKDVLISLLNGLLQWPLDEQIVDVEFLRSHSEPDAADDKEDELDLLVRDVTPFILLSIADFVMFAKRAHFKEVFLFRGLESDEVFSNHLQIVLVEMPKWRKTLESDALSITEQWMIFLKEGSKMQIQRDLLDAPWVTPEVKKAVLELERLEADEWVRELYEQRREKQFLESTLLEGARMDGLDEGRAKGRAEGIAEGRAEGRAEGIAEGIAEGRAESAKRMLHLGMSIEQVMAVMQCAREEVERLAATLKP